MLSFGEAVRRFYGGYINPHGRSQRSAYWWVVLYQVIIILVLITVLLMAQGGMTLLESFAGEIGNIGGDTIAFEVALTELGFSGKLALFLLLIFSLVNALPDIMLRIRRFHDLNQTGWLVLVFMLVGAIPGIGNLAGFANLIWFIFPGTSGANRYGNDPLGSETDIFG